MIINSRVSAVKESATLAVMSKAAGLRASGVPVLDLSTGEPEIALPDHIQEAAIAAIRSGKNRYTPIAGIPELRKAIAAKLQNENGISALPENVIVTNGGKQALHAAFDVLLEPGDEVIITAPYWVSFPAMVQLSSGVPVFVHPGVENGYKLSPQALAAAITKRTRAIVINSPSNPCGACYSKGELAALAAVLQGTDITVISDEVYEKVTFGDFRHTSFVAAAPELAEQTITVNAFSKSFAMTGWRVGYATGPTAVISAMIKHQGQTTSNVNSVAQYGALAGLNGDQGFITAMAKRFEGRINRVVDQIKEIPGLDIPLKPQGAFYLFVRIDQLLAGKNSRVKDSAGFCNYLLDTAKVAVVPGAAFGDDGAFRMSVGVADIVVDQAVAAIAAAVRDF